LILLGRKKDLINKAGVKIYPEEIDGLLRQHPSVADVCAFSATDPISGETVAVAIAFRPGSRVDFSDLENWCRERIAKVKVPTRWFELSEIQRNARGKVSRASIARLCLGESDER
jgi:acyl-CoA synthetase (AMP-forming)/AMP-acid ligase II